MQLLGLRWARRSAIQRSDGGWAQTPELLSDALIVR
jgi:hypothetical protein